VCPFVKPEEQTAILVYLLALVRLSDVAKDELNRLDELPLQIRHRQDRQLADNINTMCKVRLHDTGYQDSSENWDAWASAYRLLLYTGCDRDVMRLSINGADKQLASFDFEGKHLTGGRMWAGSVLLLQW